MFLCCRPREAAASKTIISVAERRQLDTRHCRETLIGSPLCVLSVHCSVAAVCDSILSLGSLSVQSGPRPLAQETCNRPPATRQGWGKGQIGGRVGWVQGQGGSRAGAGQGVGRRAHSTFTRSVITVRSQRPRCLVLSGRSTVFQGESAMGVSGHRLTGSLVSSAASSCPHHCSFPHVTSHSAPLVTSRLEAGAVSGTGAAGATSAALLSYSANRFCTIAGISCTYAPISR